MEVMLSEQVIPCAPLPSPLARRGGIHHQEDIGRYGLALARNGVLDGCVRVTDLLSVDDVSISVFP